jgi:hypothetical protein
MKDDEFLINFKFFEEIDSQLFSSEMNELLSAPFRIN